jgi:hypothetical protein
VCNTSISRNKPVLGRRWKPSGIWRPAAKSVLPPLSGRLGIALMMEAVCICETSVCFYEITRRQKPECCHLHTRRCEDLMSHWNLYQHWGSRTSKAQYRKHPSLTCNTTLSQLHLMPIITTSLLKTHPPASHPPQCELPQGSIHYYYRPHNYFCNFNGFQKENSALSRFER